MLSTWERSYVLFNYFHIYKQVGDNIYDLVMVGGKALLPYRAIQQLELTFLLGLLLLTTLALFILTILHLLLSSTTAIPTAS